MLRAIVTALFVTLAPAVAFAHNCPALMAEIDAALPEANLSEDELALVMELRADGEAFHEAGEHDASMAVLQDAMEILGLE